MSENLSPSEQNQAHKPSWWRGLPKSIAVCLFVAAAFVVANLLLLVIVESLRALGVAIDQIDATVLNMVFAAAIYTLSLALVIGMPWLVVKQRTSRAELGIAKSLTWTDLLVTPVAYVAYFIVSAVVLVMVVWLVPDFNLTQEQDTGFAGVSRHYELLLVFVTLVIIAPIAEELLFRGYLYSKIRTYAGVTVAILLSSVLFGAIHGQWNVALDTFSLAVIACVLREITGSIWAGTLLHSLKNGVAFYLVFVNPTMLSTLGG